MEWRVEKVKHLEGPQMELKFDVDYLLPHLQ